MNNVHPFPPKARPVGQCAIAPLKNLGKQLVETTDPTITALINQGNGEALDAIKSALAELNGAKNDDAECRATTDLTRLRNIRLHNADVAAHLLIQTKMMREVAGAEPDFLMLMFASVYKHMTHPVGAA